MESLGSYPSPRSANIVIVIDMENEFYFKACEEEKRLEKLLKAIRVVKEAYAPDSIFEKNYDENAYEAAEEQLKKFNDLFAPAKIVSPKEESFSNQNALALGLIAPVLPIDLKIEDRPYYTAFRADYRKYSTAFSQIEKTLYTLAYNGRGNTNELAQYLLKFDKELSFEKAKGIVTYHASKLFRLNLINADKKGNKNFYYLKPLKEYQKELQII